MKERPVLFSVPMVRALLAGTKTQTRRVVKVSASAKNMRMVSAGLAGFDGFGVVTETVKCPYGAPGDQLWVRETWCEVEPLSGGRLEPGDHPAVRPDGEPTLLWYRADGEIPPIDRLFDDDFRWRPSIHMPRWASRLSLRITDVRVERLQDISEEDARAEGVSGYEAPEEWHAVREAASGHLEAIAFPEQPSKAVIKALKLRDVRRYPASTVLTAKEAFERLWGSINGPESWGANPYVWAISFKRVGS